MTYNIVDKLKTFTAHTDKMFNLKKAIDIAASNAKSVEMEQKQLDKELREMQLDHTKEIEQLQKTFELKKSLMEEEIAKMKISQLRMSQQAKLLALRANDD